MRKLLRAERVRMRCAVRTLCGLTPGLVFVSLSASMTHFCSPIFFFVEARSFLSSVTNFVLHVATRSRNELEAVMHLSQQSKHAGNLAR